MSGRSERGWVLVVALCWAVALATAVHAGPVDLMLADSQVFVQDNGAADVIYTLRFRDNQGRSVIKKIGQFYEPVHFTRATIEGEGLAGTVTMEALGGGYYRAELPGRTRAGKMYTLELHFRSNHRFADPTTRDGRKLLAVWFNPVRWGLPVERSVIKLVLPLELPAEVKRHEDITPAMVDRLGVVTDPSILAAQSHWAFVYTDYRGKRRLTLYAEKTGLPSQGTHLVRVYIPAAALPGVASGRDVEASGAAEAERFIARGPLRLLAQRYVLVTLARRGKERNGAQSRRPGVEVRTILEYEETASRNFVPAPPVTVGLPRGGKPVPTSIRVWLDGRPVAGKAVAGRRVHLGRFTHAGQRLRVATRSFYPVRFGGRAVVENGEAWLPVELAAFRGVTIPGLDSAPVTVEVWTGLPAGSGDTPPVRPVEPPPGAWKLETRPADAGRGLPSGAVLVARPPPGPVRLRVLAPAGPLGVPVGVWGGTKLLVEHLLHGELRQDDLTRVLTFLTLTGTIALILFVANAALLLLELLAFGWVLAIIDKIAKTHLFRRAFGLTRGTKLVHPTRGLLFGWNALLVPFRILWMLAAAVVLPVLRLHPRLAVALAPPPPSYEAPEITVATFAQPGKIPDLTPPEAAVMAGKPIKAINLVVLALAQRGALRILSRNPLQVEVVDASLARDAVERAFLEALDANGLLPAAGIRSVIETINEGLQPKLWRADLDATAAAQRRATEEAWRTFESTPAAQRTEVFDQLYDRLYLDDHFFQRLQGNMAGLTVRDDPSSPLAALASSRAVRTLEGTVGSVQEMAEGVVTGIENVAAATVDRVEQFFAFDGESLAA
ncbi:MAG TPA: hypothetical protein ENK19_01535, partial [Acidobacteria bacterium]|nr:hypothetical protein [Acidobacteriota bacterium]